MKLNDIRDNPGARKTRTRVGRGIGSGKGKTGGRGQKGQKSRSGVSIKGFEGGQMPLHMRLPKRGFNNPFAKDYAEVNVGQVQKLIDAGTLDARKVIDQAALQAAGIASGGKHGVRLLGKGELTAKASFTVAGASKGAIAAVEKAGGSVEVIVVKPASEKAAEKKAAGAAARKTTSAARAPKKSAKAKPKASEETAEEAAVEKAPEAAADAPEGE